jgi:hypothetical protein
LSHAIPNSLIKEDWQLVLEQEASVEQLEHAIERCKELVLSADEYSTERKWLVHHLVELKFRLAELQDVGEQTTGTATTFRVVLGHHFVTGRMTHSKTYCDHCCGIIWNVVQASYICNGMATHTPIACVLNSEYCSFKIAPTPCTTSASITLSEFVLICWSRLRKP